ncbi:phosphatase PAP2 family protein [Helicobacter acinonychis]|uniref:phosphatase PAP2 family protein n=1 Tax=Helicobacter acinonychis TaxID=212 RepID=UPI0002D34E72|nr:phosphatase PAP2 family protein [Helicobacter acinonychis]STP04983.1 PAP2 superfamily protein [Helicobacter acinonychis]
MKRLKGLFLSLLLCLYPLESKPLSNGAYVLEEIGDVLRFLPIFVGTVSLAMRDYRGLGELAVGTLVTQGVIYGIKGALSSAHKNGARVDFAKRPCCNSWRGMPSGHAGGAFSAAGFVYYRYGWKPALPVIALAFLTDVSRVVAKKHTILQVTIGSLISWGFAYLFTSRYKPKQWMLYPEISSDFKGRNRYGVSFSYEW